MLSDDGGEENQSQTVHSSPVSLGLAVHIGSYSKNHICFKSGVLEGPTMSGSPLCLWGALLGDAEKGRCLSVGLLPGHPRQLLVDPFRGP